ncbi:MAG: EamA family transporter [Curtobacterium sp.]
MPAAGDDRDGVGHGPAASRLGVLAIVVTAVLWGTTGTVAAAAPTAGPLAIGAAALGIGGLLQAAIAVRPLRAAWPVLRRHRGLVALGGLAVAVYPLAFYSSMHVAGVAIGSVVSLASAPLASGVLERVVDHRPLGRRWVVAAAIGVAGSTVLCLSGAGAAHGATDAAGLADAAGTAAAAGATDPAATVLGVLLGLVAGATYAVYSWAAHRLMGAGAGRAASMGAVFGTGGVLLLPVLLLTGGPFVTSPSDAAVGLSIALVPMFLGYLLFGVGLASVRPSTATTITLLEPAVATVLAVLVVGERLGPAGWAGLALLGIALVLLVAPPVRRPARS